VEIKSMRTNVCSPQRADVPSDQKPLPKHRLVSLTSGGGIPENRSNRVNPNFPKVSRGGSAAVNSEMAKSLCFRQSVTLFG
jgi:hypothetical protein